MTKRTLSALVLLVAAAAFSNQMSDKTIIRMAAMPVPPVIDGKISGDEWRYASTTFGGISRKTGLMTFRQNDFILGYDAKYIYVSITSEIPLDPQPLTKDDRVEFRFIAPGKTKPVIVEFDHTGKGTFPAGTKIANGFGISLMNSEQGKCWITEAAIPLSAFGLTSIENGKEWKFQMMRHWSSIKETGYFHLPKKNNEMATFIPDNKAVIVSFDGFGHGTYKATGNYDWTYRVENPHSSRQYIHSKSFRSGLSGAPTLDINNPDLLGKETRARIGYSLLSEPGKSNFFRLYLMAQFPGKSRCLYSEILDNSKKVLYQRVMFWDTSISQKAAVYKDEVGYPYLSSAFYPSHGNKLRVAATFNKKMPVGYAEIKVRNSKGKVLHTFKKTNYGSALNDFEDQTVLPGLPLDDYTVTMDTIALDGRKFSHKRTFSIRKFPWQGLNLGKERVIIPPFKPLKYSPGNVKEVHALMTGYRLGGGIWSEIYAEKENILAAPVQLFLNGEPVKAGNIRLISGEKDRVVFEMTSQLGNVNFVLTQDYDYDGFCKLTVKVIPQGTVKVNSFELHVPVKDKYVKYYGTLNASRARSLGKPDWTIPSGQGELPMKAAAHVKGKIQNYVWLGGEYKGISWIIDTQKGFALDRNSYPYKLIRKGDTVTFIQQMVNIPAEWDKPWEFEMGFSPTPVKPQAQEFRCISQYMYDYPYAKGSVQAGGMNFNPWPLGYYYDINAVPNGDNSYYRQLIAARGRGAVPEAERVRYADEYIARNREWLRKNAPLASEISLRRSMIDRRSYGGDYFLLYHNPAFYSYRWKEAEMYKAEWLPWDYPVDDAMNEYIACQTPEYIDKLLWEMKEQIKVGFDGMNFDCFPLGGGFNTVSMKAFRERPGRVPVINNSNMLQTASPGIATCTNLFGWRELMKRTAHLLYTENRLLFGVPWVELHSTNATVPSVAAFCSTVITTECASKGYDYYDRFPVGYALGDLTGTQAGVIPRPIFSTLSTRIPTADQLRSMISFSFAYGMMNHCDQGITGRCNDYRIARDEVFSFGYGRKENKTIAFYDKAQQPITCNAKGVRTTQVIRPDGKALLMIGNTGDSVLATFNLSGLNYPKYKITDVFTGKVLNKAEVQLPKQGYALWKIEKL